MDHININSPASRKRPLRQLVADALVEIEQAGYSKRSVNRYRTTWERLIEFSDRGKLGDVFSGDLLARFLEKYRLADSEMARQGEGWRRHIVWELKVLAEFAENSHIARAFPVVKAIHLVPAMQKVLREYQRYTP